MLIGSYKHQLDAKNRIRIPVAFKQQMQGPLVMGCSVNGCIGVYTQQQFEEIFSKYASTNQFRADEQKYYTKFFMSLYEVEEDNQGRILVDASLLKHAEIKKDVVTVGKFNHLEIWAPERLYGDGDEGLEKTFEFLSKVCEE